MPRIKEITKCARCNVEFHRHNGNINARYCSRLCACRDRNTRAHQKKAGKVGGRVTGEKTRGTGTKGYVKRNQRHEHRSVAEKMINRKLKKGEIVHHIDENKHNNTSKNLMVITQSEHIKIHKPRNKKHE